MPIKQPEEILFFWFSEAIQPLWFEKDLVFDQEILQVFGATYQEAKSGNLAHWQQDPLSSLALTIVFDQFPRNMYRNTPAAFATDDQALQTAKNAVIQKFHEAMSKKERMFLFMPFMHSESKVEQAISLTLFTELGLPDALGYASQHKKVIDHFGRFPHRNAILGREGTPEEKAYLQENINVFEKI